MSRGNAPFSSVDEAALAALASCHIQTQQAVQELARAIARDRGIELQQPQSDQPRQKTRHYRLSNMSRDGNGGLAGDLEYADGRVRRFRLDRGETGELVGYIEDLDPVADATPAPTTEAAPEPSGMFGGVFGSIEGP